MLCSGYRNQLDLIFRDESEKVVDKHRTRMRKRELATKSQQKVRVNAVQSIPKAGVHRMEFPIKDCAIDFFLGRYILGSHFEWLPGLYQTTGVDETLLTSIQAVSLASLSLEIQRPDLMDIARRHHIFAIRSLNKALRCPASVLRDATIASVTLLGLFETLAYDLGNSPDNWANHANGSLALLRLRGPGQFGSALGLKLFKHIDSNIRVNCVQRKIRIPAELHDLNDLAAPWLEANDPVMRFRAVVTSFTDLRAAIHVGDISNPLKFVRMANEIDNLVLSLIADMPHSWRYDVVHLQKNSPDVFRGQYHTYKDHRMTQFWNTLRMTRLSLHEIIYAQADLARATKDNDAVSQLSEVSNCSASIAENIVTDICASVHQYTRCSNPTVGVAFGYFLIWPLCMAGASPLSSKQSVSYITAQLRCLGNKLKLPQAIVAANALELGLFSEDWQVYSLHVIHVSANPLLGCTCTIASDRVLSTNGPPEDTLQYFNVIQPRLLSISPRAHLNVTMIV